MTGALGDLLTMAFDGHGAVHDVAGQATEFQLLRAQAATVAQALTAQKLGAEEPVHVAIGNRPGDLAGLLAVWQAGGVAVPVADAAHAATAQRLEALTGARLRVAGSEVTPIADRPPPARPLLRGAALILSTSGSTGLPKGVVLGHQRFAAKLDVLGALLRLTAADAVVLPLRLTFVFGLWVSLLALRQRARLTLVSRFSPVTIANCLRDATVLAAVPSMLRTLLAEDALVGAGPRLLLTGGEALGAPLRQAVEARWPASDVHDLYGLTETGACDFCAARADAGGGAIGRPTSGVDVRIAATAGEAGELLIRSPFGMLGYLDAPDLTEAACTDGFFRTGDVARVRPDGLVDLVGRTKEIISRGGNKIAPQEIDDLLSSHPALVATLTTGVPHPRLGEALFTVAVRKPGATVTPAELRQWAAERLERFKLPDAITFADALPTGSTGKASRALLREQASASPALRNPTSLSC